MGREADRSRSDAPAEAALPTGGATSAAAQTDSGPPSRCDNLPVARATQGGSGGVGVAQLPLQHLADRAARQFVHHLIAADPLRLADLGVASARTASASAPSFSTRTPTGVSPHSSLGTPTTAASTTRSSASRSPSRSLGIDVEPARNDHVLGAVHQDQEAVLVEPPDVAVADVAAAFARRAIASRWSRRAGC